MLHIPLVIIHHQLHQTIVICLMLSVNCMLLGFWYEDHAKQVASAIERHTVGKRNYFTKVIPYFTTSKLCTIDNSNTWTTRILGRNVIHSWFRGIKRNLLCSFQDMKIPTSRSVVKYGIGIYKISREVWNSPLSLHCYCFGWTIQQLQEVCEVGFRSPWSSSAYPQWAASCRWQLFVLTELVAQVKNNVNMKPHTL